MTSKKTVNQRPQTRSPIEATLQSIEGAGLDLHSEAGRQTAILITAACSLAGRHAHVDANDFIDSFIADTALDEAFYLVDTLVERLDIEKGGEAL